MRITKTMKEVIEQRLTEKRLAANKAARADYDAKREACIEEIKTVLEEAREQVATILSEHGMDAKVKYCGDMEKAEDFIVDFHDSYIRNNKEASVLSEAESARYKAQQDAIQNIIFDAEAGGDKESLLAAIDGVTF